MKIRTLYYIVLSLTTFILASCHASQSTSSTAQPELTIADDVPSAVVKGNTVTYIVTISNRTVGAQPLLAATNAQSDLTLESFTPPAGFSIDNTLSTCKVGQKLVLGGSCNLVLSASFSQDATISSSVIIKTSANTISHAIKFKVVTPPAAGITRISLVGKELTLIPGATSSLTYKNTGTTEINTLELKLPSYLSSVITNADLTYPGDLKPGQSAVFKFDIPDTFTFTNEQLAAIEGAEQDPSSSPIQLISANTEPAVPTLQAFQAISINSLAISSPNQSSGSAQTITVHNNSAVPVLISAVTTSSLPTGVTLASDNDHCLNKVLAADQSCAMNLTSATTANGSGTLAVTYAPQAAPHNTAQLSSSVSVAKTSLSFLTSTLHLKQNVASTVTVTNTGNFAWQLSNSQFSLAKNSTGPVLNPDDLAISDNACSNLSSLAPAQTCQLTLLASLDSTAGAYDLAFTAGNSNASDITKTFQVDQAQSTLTVALDDDWSGQGIGLKRFIITNDADESAKPLSSLTFSLQQEGSQLKDSNPAVAFTTGSDACSANTSLAGDQTCYLYVKAQNNQGLGAQHNWQLQVSAGGQSKQFNLNYDEYLYLAGRFSIETGEDSYYVPVYRYDGSNWTNLSTSSNGGEFNDSVHTLKVSPRTGNLYAGGSFTNESTWTSGQGYYLAKYNGQNWQDLGQGPSTEAAPAFNGAIYDIAFDQNNNVYTGGRFTTGENRQSGNYYLAKYSNDSWSSLGTGPSGSAFVSILRSIAFDQHDNFYVNNNYDIAYYNQQTQNWQNIDTNLYPTRSLIFDANDNSLYIADWSYNTYQYLGDETYNRGVASTLTDPSTGPVYYMALYQNKLYRLVLDWRADDGINPYHFVQYTPSSTGTGTWQDLTSEDTEILGTYGSVPRLVITGNGIAYITINNYNGEGYYLQPYNINSQTWMSAVHAPESMPMDSDIYGLAIGSGVSVGS